MQSYNTDASNNKISLKSASIPKRWHMVALLFTGILVVFTLRVNMSVAATDMQDELNWSEARKGLMLSAFYWGYAIGQIPSSRMVQLYGAKVIFGLSILLPSLLTLLMPVACKNSFGLALFIRALIGLCESASFPAVFHFFPLWIPLAEKTLLIPTILSGMYMGNIVGFLLSGLLINTRLVVHHTNLGEWPAVFYVSGLLGITWIPWWVYCAYESPESHPSITQEEVAFIAQGKTPIDESNDDKQAEIIPDESRLTGSWAYGEYGGQLDEGARSRGTSRTGSKVDSRGNSKEGSRAGALKEVLLKSPVSSFSYRSDEEGEWVGQSPSSSLPALQSTLNPMAISHRATDDGAFPQSTATSNPSQPTNPPISTPHPPYRTFLTHPVSLTLLSNSWCFAWISFTLLSEMPSYLTDSLDFSSSSAGILCVFPYIALFIATLMYGRVFLYLQAQHNMSVYMVRQVAEYIALLGSSLGMILCVCVGNRYASYTMLIITQFFLGAIQSGLGCAYSDVCPVYSSSLNSIGNCVGAIAGLLGPLIVSACLQSHPGVWGWRIAFFISAGFGVVGSALWGRYMVSGVVPELNTLSS